MISDEAVEAAARAVSMNYQNYLASMRIALEAAYPLLVKPELDREKVWEAVVAVRDAAPRVPNDADSWDIVDAVMALLVKPECLGDGVCTNPRCERHGIKDTPVVTDEAVEAAAQTINDEGGQPGHSIHSWRCEHPDRFGECDCVRQIARAVLETAAPLLGTNIGRGGDGDHPGRIVD